MPTEESIEELLDRAIDEVLSKNKKPEEDIKKRRPKPISYLTRDRTQTEFANQETQISMMKEESKPEIVEDKLFILGLGDVEVIENVLKKHEVSKITKDK